MERSCIKDVFDDGPKAKIFIIDLIREKYQSGKFTNQPAAFKQFSNLTSDVLRRLGRLV